jgi:polyribonucleotide nucleotidyltransferase
VVSEILESNSSSSMATVCGASLALMDAGVPIKKAVVGVGVGLIKDGEREVLLTDMLGEEDHLGDMDFKVAGTADGVTAIQLDIKIDGVTIDLMARAMDRARDARLKILEIMNACLDKSRDDLSPYAPRITTIQIDPERIGELIGPGGKIIRGIQEEAGVVINVEDDGSVQIASTNSESSELALSIITEMFAVVEVGQEFTGKVARITSFGAFVEVMRGQEGLVHISDLAEGYVRRVEDVVNIGDSVTVRVMNVDDRGRIDLKPVDPLTPKEGTQDEGAGESGGPDGEQRPPRSGDSRGDRPGGGGGRGGGGRGGGGRDRGGRDRGPRRDSGGGRGGPGRSSDSRGGGGRDGGGDRRDAPRVPKGRF